MCSRMLWLPALLVGVGVASVAVAQRAGSAPGEAVPLIQNVRGGYALRGDVTAIDGQTGIVALKTDKGDLRLYFPPGSLEGVREGDRLEVRLAFVLIGGPPRGSPAGSSPAPADPTTKTR